MSFLKALLRFVDPQPPPRSGRTNPSARGGTIQVNPHEMDFLEFMPHAKSTDGAYRLTWSGGHNNELGRYVLSHRGIQLCSGNLVRPGEGQVAGNGTFILTDLTGGLTSRFYGFTSDGTQIVECVFRALPFNIGISESGNCAVVQLCNAPSKEDGGVLVFLDLISGRVRWKRGMETGWADSYKFDDVRQELGLSYSKFGVFRYSFENGEFLDSEKWERKRIQYGSGYNILSVCRERFAKYFTSISSANVRELQDLVKQALDKRDIKDDDRAIARALRLSGEIHEHARNFHEAIEQYEKALEFDEKVGVKLKLRRLQRELSD